MPPAVFEPAILAGDRPQIFALDRSATGIGHGINSKKKTAYLTALQLLDVAVTIPTVLYLFTSESHCSLSQI